MKSVLVVSGDSDIGSAIVNVHRKNGDAVAVTSRVRGKGDLLAELSHPGQWTVPTQKLDMVYYALAIGNDRSSRAEVMQVNVFSSLDYLKFIAPYVNDNGQLVVLTTTNSNLKQVAKDSAPVYAMSKAALNLGVKLIALNAPRLRWTLLCPGRVRTKMNAYVGRTDVYTPEQAGGLIVSAASAVQAKFCFINQHGDWIE